MSLEASITELNTNVRALIDALAKVNIPAPANLAAAQIAKEDKPAKEVKAEKKSPTPAPTASSPSDAQPQSTAQADVAPAASSVTYDEVKAAILTLSKEKGREPTVALMSQFGVAKGPDLKPEQYADFIAEVNKLLAAEEALA